METRRKPFWIAILMISVLIFACVTINIYFPAEKVESVAGDIVDDIRGHRNGEQGKSLKNDKGSFLMKTITVFSPTVCWAEDVTGISNPTIRSLKQRLKGRFAQMKPYYQKGLLKEGNNGYVSIANTKGLGLKEKRDLNSYVNAENKDRRTLYAEVAKALKIEASQINRIAGIFAKEWQKSVK